MIIKIDLSKVLPWDQYFDLVGSKDKDVDSILGLHREAREYLGSLRWCSAILEESVGFVYPGIVAVFLFKIDPARDEVDEWVWIIVGDVPAAYITCEESPNPACALDAYIGAMEQWVDAAGKGLSVEGLIPVGVKATKENAERLRVRLKFLDEKILSRHADDLRAS